MTTPELNTTVTLIIKKFPENYKIKIDNILSAGYLYQTNIQTAGGLSKIYFHLKGIELQEANSLIKKCCIDSKLPECLRLAHLIGKLF